MDVKTLCALTGLICSLSTQASNTCHMHFTNDKLQNTAQLLQWSADAAKLAFAYDYKNHGSHFSDYANCFSHSGWQSFQKALKLSGNIEAVTAEQLRVSASLIAPAQITQHTPHTWKVRVPLHVKYENDYKQAQQDLMADIQIVVKKDNDGRNHYGIIQFIARPNA